MRLKLFLSLALAIIIITHQIFIAPISPITPILILLGVFLSTFFLDLEFLLQAYIYDPATSLAENVRQLVAQKNLTGLLAFTTAHQDELLKPILRSSLFQAVLTILCVYLVFSKVTLLGTSFALGILLQSLILGWDRRNRDWFWELKMTLPPLVINAYFLSLTVILIYLLIA